MINTRAPDGANKWCGDVLDIFGIVSECCWTEEKYNLCANCWMGVGVGWMGVCPWLGFPSAGFMKERVDSTLWSHKSTQYTVSQWSKSSWNTYHEERKNYVNSKIQKHKRVARNWSMTRNKTALPKKSECPKKDRGLGLEKLREI